MLELDGIGFHYPRRDWVFRGVDCVMAAGTATAVLGPNGSGKTTLVRCAAGLLSPIEGRVHGTGSVGFVPQARGGTFAYPALDMVLMGRARQVGLFRSPSAADRAAALEAMERVGVAGLQARPFPTLSGGEQQLVLIARAIAAAAPVLVLDEPATGLDLKNQARVLSLLAELTADGLTLLLSTHHPDHALFLADAVVLMGPDGVRAGPAEQLLTAPTLSALYGVRVSTVTGGGADGRSIIAHYDRPA